MPTEMQAPMVKPARPALVLKVNYLEAIDGGFEKGLPFTLVWENPEVFADEEARTLFLKSLTIIDRIESGYDYAVYRVIPDGIDYPIGPGDHVVVYDDRHFGCYIGVGEVDVVDGQIIIKR